MNNPTCNAASCRNGWPISLTMQEYFILQSLATTRELRDRINARLQLLSNPTLECYAQLSPNHRGVCPLHCQDESCALQDALGENG